MPDLRRNNHPGPCGRKIKHKPRSYDAEQAPPLRFFCADQPGPRPPRAREKHKPGKTDRRTTDKRRRVGSRRGPRKDHREGQEEQPKNAGPTPGPLPIGKCNSLRSPLRPDRTRTTGTGRKPPENHGKQPKRGKQGKRGKRKGRGDYRGDR